MKDSEIPVFLKALRSYIIEKVDNRDLYIYYIGKSSWRGLRLMMGYHQLDLYSTKSDPTILHNEATLEDIDLSNPDSLRQIINVALDFVEMAHC